MDISSGIRDKDDQEPEKQLNLHVAMIFQSTDTVEAVDVSPVRDDVRMNMKRGMS